MIYRNGTYYDRMIRNGITYSNMVRNGIVYGDTSGPDPSTLAILDYAQTNGYVIPTDTEALDALIVSLKSIGVWSKMDILYLFANDGDDNFRLINYKNPGLFQATKHGVTMPSRDEYGFNGNGSSGYINTHFNPALSGVNYTSENACRIAVVSKAASTTVQMSRIDGLEGTQTTVNHMMLMNQAAQRINQSSNSLDSSVDLSGTGMTSIHRTSATQVMLQKKDIFYNRTASGSGAASANQIILSAGSSGAGVNYSNGGVAFYAMGSALTQQECIDVRGVINQYLTSVGLLAIA